MCCRGRNSRRGFGPARGGFGTRCGPNRGFIADPAGTYEHRPRGLFGFLAAKRAEKKAAREAHLQYQSRPDTEQAYGYIDQNAFQDGRREQQQQQQQGGSVEWQDEKQGYRALGFQAGSQRKETSKYADRGNGNANVRLGSQDNLEVTPPRYSMVMRE